MPIPTVMETSAQALATVHEDYAGSSPSAEGSLRWTNAQGTQLTYLDVILSLRVSTYPVHAYASSRDDLTCVHYVITPLLEATEAANGRKYIGLRRFAVEAEWHLHDTSQPCRRYFFDRTPETTNEQDVLHTLDPGQRQ